MFNTLTHTYTMQVKIDSLDRSIDFIRKSDTISFQPFQSTLILKSTKAHDCKLKPKIWYKVYFCLIAICNDHYQLKYSISKSVDMLLHMFVTMLTKVNHP